MNKKYLLLLWALLCIGQLAFAASDDSAGNMAANLMEPVVVLANFINSACIVIGGTFIFSGVIKYLQHRINPLAVPIGTVVFMFIGGIVLLCLPLAYMLTGDEKPPYLQTDSKGKSEVNDNKKAPAIAPVAQEQ